MSCLVERNKEGKIIAVKLDSNNVKQTVKLKSGVDFVFEQNTELSSIGTQEEYSQYLESIFPNSKRKEIFYHGTFDSSNKETYFREGIEETDLRTWNFFYNDLPSALNIGMNPYAVMLDFSADINSTEGEYKSVLTNQTSDSAIIYESNATSDEYAVKNRSQIHILGSQNDIEGFRNFVNANLKSGNISNNSELFNNILTMPFIDDRTALNMYMPTLTDKFKAKFINSPMITNELGEPKLFFKTGDGFVYDNYKDALKNRISGFIEVGFIHTDDVEVNSELFNTLNNDLVVDSSQFTVKYKLNNNEAFDTLIEIDSSTDKTQYEGMVNNLILEEVLSSQRILMDGNLYYKGAGELESTIMLTSQIVRDEFVREFGRESVLRLENGLLDLKKVNNNEVEIIDSNGKVTKLNYDELERDLGSNISKIEKKDSNFIQLLYNVIRRKFNIFSGELTSVTESSEQELALKLTKVLTSLGTKVTSMSSYLEKYNNKNNIDPSAEALADIAKNVISFAEGQDNIENFTEETAHFIIEAYINQQEIEDALLEIENTDEWNQYNKIYYDIYSKNYSGEQLDNIVRREILGKILSKKIQDNFNESDSLINKLRTIFNKFVNYVRQFINPTVKKNLQEVVDDLAEKVLNEEITDYISNENFESNPFIFYSLNDKRTLATLMQGKQVLEKRLLDLKKLKSSKIAEQTNLLNSLNTAINDNEELTAINIIKSSTESLYKDLERKLSTNTAWDYNDIKFFNDLVNQNVDLLETSREILNTTVYENETLEKNRQPTINQINDLLNRISVLKGKSNIKEQDSFNLFVNKLTSQYTHTEKQKTEIQDLLEREFKEISWFQANFASLEHAREPILNMLGFIISQNNFKADRNMQKIGNPILRIADEQKWTQKDFESLMEVDEKGIPTGYFIAPTNIGDYKNKEKLATINAYKEVFNLPNLTVEEFDKQMTPNNSTRSLKLISEIYDETHPKFSLEEKKKFKDLMQRFYRENDESRYSEDFLNKRNDLLRDLNIGQETQDILSQISVDRGVILSKYKNKEGILDWSTISEYDASQLNELEERRKGFKISIDVSTGERKEGINLKIAEDLKRLDEYYQKQDKDKLGIKPEFFNKLNEIIKDNGLKRAFNWFNKNAGFRFNSKFWDNLSNKESIINRLDRVLDKNNELKDNIDDYNRLKENTDKLKILLEKKSDILKQFQHSIDPSEIDTNNMYSVTKNLLKQIEGDLQDVFYNINNILYKYDENSVTENITENTINNSYLKELKESNLPEYKFILENVTTKDYDRIEGFRILLNDIKNNKGNVNISSSYRGYLENLIGENDIDNNIVKDYITNLSIDELSINFGKTKLLPYFKRFAPKGYDELLTNLKNGKISVNDVINDIKENKGVGQFLEVDTKFSWKEDTTDNEVLNPDYIENFEGGYHQPKWSKYKNKNFFRELGFDEERYFKGEGLYLIDLNNRRGIIYKHLIDLKKIGLERYNEYGRENLYKLPQESKGTYQKLEAGFKNNPGKVIMNTIKDFTQNRVDSQEFGERLGLDDTPNRGEVRVIPKYGIRDLEEKTDISSELLHTSLMFVNGALLYEQKVDTISDVNVLEQELESKIKKVGNNFSDNRTLKTFKNFMDAYFHGVQRTRQFFIHLPNGKKIDVSKLVIQFDKWVRNINIGFSFFVAATSLTTAEINLRIESIVGDYIDNNSVSFAGSEFLKLAPQTFTDIGQFNKKSKLYLLGEALGIHNLAEKTSSSNYSPFLRSMNGLPHKMSEMANFPIINRVMISVLDANRLVDGKVMDFKVFKEFNKELNLTKKELNDKWNNYRNSSFYNMLEIKADNTIGFKQEFINQVGYDYLENQLNLVRNELIRVNGYVDSVVPMEDKSAATRDFLMSFTTAHRGWLSIGVSRKTKSRQFNFMTGQVEEGQYVSVSNLISNVAKDLNEKGFKNLIKVLKDNYNLMSDFERRNVKRTLVELGMYVALLGLGLLVVGIADDDDNKDLWALQTASYIYIRTVNETGSMQAPMGLLNLIDVAQSPFIALNNIKQMTQSNALSFEPVATGEYQGMPKILKTGIKQTYLRHWYEVKDAETVRKKRQYFTNVLNSEVLIGLQSKSKKEKEAEK